MLSTQPIEQVQLKSERTSVQLKIEKSDENSLNFFYKCKKYQRLQQSFRFIFRTSAHAGK